MASGQSEAETRSEHSPTGRSRHRAVAWLASAAALLAVGSVVAGFRLCSVHQPQPQSNPLPVLASAPAVTKPAPAKASSKPAPEPAHAAQESHGPAASAEPTPEPSPVPAEKPGAARLSAAKRSAKPLGVGEIQKTVQGHYQSMSRCLRKLDPASSPASIAAKLTITANGRVTGVLIEPALTAAPARCLQTALRSIRFRPGPSGFHITIPLNIEHAGR